MELDWIHLSEWSRFASRVVYISPFLSSSLSVLLPSSRTTADRSTTNSLLLPSSSSSDHHLKLFSLSSSHDRKKTSSEAKKEEAFPKDWEEEVLPATIVIKISRGRCHQTQK